MQKRPFANDVVPVLETARLLLRRHQIADFEACAGMWSDPGIVRFIGGKTFTSEDVWARILRYVGHWSLLGYGYLAIEEKASGEFIGEVGLAEFRRDITPPLANGPEAGWVLRTASQGRGFAEEALRAVLEWGRDNIEARNVHCLINDDNHASIKLAEKCMFRPQRAVSYKGYLSMLYERRI
jgi:RimJ/RimL family protein N-acetyltransferase